MHLSARLRQPRDLLRLCAELERRGVFLISLAPFYAEGPAMAGLLFGFGAIETADIDPALDILRELLVQG
jgi:GntR family transcriptional regulator/MocR family aminotransferase